MITIWGRRSSSNVQAVMWCIAELDLPHKRLDAGLHYGVSNTDEYLKMNPNGTVPTIRDGDQPALWESGAIVRYLANQYGGEPFWPTDPIQRANIDRWAEWSKINIALKFTAPVFWLQVRTAPSKRDPGAIAQGLSIFEQNLAIADRQLAKHKYLAGDAFTLADIQFGHVLFRYFDIDINRQPPANVERYYNALCLREPFLQHVMVDYSELRVEDEPENL